MYVNATGCFFKTQDWKVRRDVGLVELCSDCEQLSGVTVAFHTQKSAAAVGRHIKMQYDFFLNVNSEITQHFQSDSFFSSEVIVLKSFSRFTDS